MTIVSAAKVKGHQTHLQWKVVSMCIIFEVDTT